MAATRQELLDELAREQARLAEIDRQREATRSRMESLREELAVSPSLEPTRPVLPVVANPESSRPLRQATLRVGAPMTRLADALVPTPPLEKVRLFRALFKGREGILPTRFVSKKTGKPGYAPACTNKFVRGLCELPMIKCGECPNQAFIPFDDQIVVDHLQGRKVVGVYPLLEDETCWFLAVDFDKSSWQDDVGAFVETCRALDLPPSVERSRSGNGAHAWFFFVAPVAASLARKMGCYLLTEAMSRRHQLSMESYDRLFPNQDTMPRGGFGNLIALPLQYEPRKQGNSVFVDERFQAYADQWAYLASVTRIAPSVVQDLARDATNRGLVVGLRLAQSADDEEAAPWMRRPSGRPRHMPVAGPL